MAKKADKAPGGIKAVTLYDVVMDAMTRVDVMAVLSDLQQGNAWQDATDVTREFFSEVSCEYEEVTAIDRR